MRKILVGLTTAALIASAALPALAGPPGFPGGSESHDITISSTNFATVMNSVMVKADTGDNDANGDEGGNGGDAGDVEDNDNEGGSQTNTSGNGGAGGAGGNGGTITTGNADALVAIENYANIIDNKINACACPDEAEDSCGSCVSTCGGCGGHDHDNDNNDDCGCVGDMDIIDFNMAYVDNSVFAKADTGDNDVNGDEGGNGGDAGDVEDNDNEAKDGKKDDHHHGCGDTDEGADQTNTSGNGGAGGKGGTGGSITTGAAWSQVSIFNVVNSVINRILR